MEPSQPPPTSTPPVTESTPPEPSTGPASPTPPPASTQPTPPVSGHESKGSRTWMIVLAAVVVLAILVYIITK